MNLELSKFLNSLSIALDYVEAEVLNVTPYHGKRVAVLTNKMAHFFGMDHDAIYSLSHAAALHDCALAENLSDTVRSFGYELDELNMGSHCTKGEGMLSKLSFYENCRGSVLYHHERADGKGAFGKTASETPISAQLIHIADNVDVKFDLFCYEEDKLERIISWLKSADGTMFSSECIEAFETVIDNELLASIAGDEVEQVIDDLIPEVSSDVPIDVFRNMASIFGEVTDYKSHFTWNHSIGIAEKAEKMGVFYGENRDVCAKLYIAGALHDIGKMLISNEILEKPARLTNEEYKIIQNHALGTYDLLNGIGGIEDIASWASLHHEKLNGSGYPFGYTADRLGRNERLLACLDIYQALVEERPYKSGMPHDEAMGILRKMVNDGQLDGTIVEDIDECFGGHADEATATESRYAGDVLENVDFEGEVWRCSVCGYIHEGELPSDIICPRCEQPASVFEKIR